MELKAFDLGLSDSQIDTINLAMYVIWLFYLPILAKFIVQIVSATLATGWFAIRSLKKSKPSKKTAMNLPRVSVVVPAYNEEVGIVKTMKSVLNNSYSNTQLIVVNDGSTDKTHEKITSFLKDFTQDLEKGESSSSSSSHVSLTYLRLENGGKAKAMNQAMTTVDPETSIVITVDADSVMDKHAIREMVACFGDDENVGAVAGNVIVANRAKFIGMIQQLEYLSGFFFKRGDSVFNAVYIIGGAAAAYRKVVLEKVGAFDDSIITEDIELSTRILAHNYKTRYAHNAVVFTEGPSDWMGLANQRLRWKYGRIVTFLKHRRLFFSLAEQKNMYLSWFLLPLTVYADFFLLMEVWLILPLCVAYILFVNMWTFLCVIIMLTTLVLFQVAVDRKRLFHSNLIPLAPLAWIASMLIELIEWTALVRSLWRLARGESLQWQKWKRVGISVDDDDDEDSDADSHDALSIETGESVLHFSEDEEDEHDTVPSSSVASLSSSSSSSSAISTACEEVSAEVRVKSDR